MGKYKAGEFLADIINFFPVKMSSLIVSAIFLAFVLVPGFDGATPDSTCEGGALHSDSKASGHSLQWTKALISKPAPFWEGTAVIKGSMKEIKLTDSEENIWSFFSTPWTLLL